MTKLAITLAYGLAAAALCVAAAPAQSAEYCCACKGQAEGKTIESFSRGMAVGQCSLECGAFTNVTSGKCAPPPPAAVPAPAAAAPAPASTGAVLVYKSEDCSGDAVRLRASTARLDPGMHSFSVESGAPASAWAQTDYAGTRTEPVGPSICVAPGFEILSIKLD
jgi:hypothetical protein